MLDPPCLGGFTRPRRADALVPPSLPFPSSNYMHKRGRITDQKPSPKTSAKHASGSIPCPRVPHDGWSATTGRRALVLNSFIARSPSIDGGTRASSFRVLRSSDVFIALLLAVPRRRLCRRRAVARADLVAGDAHVATRRRLVALAGSDEFCVGLQPDREDLVVSVARGPSGSRRCRHFRTSRRAIHPRCTGRP
jgi:hypothetical protein